MSSSHVDRNLLFGFLALQINFISREDLIAAVSAWLVDKSRQLSDILRERKSLSEDEFQIVAAIAAKHLEKHGNDPEKSLAALPTIDLLPRQLTKLGDADIEASLNHLAQTEVNNQPLSAETLAPSGVSMESSRFRIMRPHARGGLGEVFVAKDTELNRDVALKEIQLYRADDEDSRARFVLEAEITGGLEHPGVVPVYGFGKYPDGRPYYAMRFIRGDSLKDALSKFHFKKPTTADFNSLTFRALLRRFIDVCNAMEYAHSRGVLHRDLKPGNIMLGKYGETLVVDWGLAKVQGRDDLHSKSDEHTLQPRSKSGSVATALGSAVGTPPYMSPEQAAGRLDQMGAAADIYSLGATLYSALTGLPPVRGSNTGTVLEKVQKGDFPKPREMVAGVPKPLEAICMKAMALAPSDRYESAVALADDLDRWLADEPLVAYRENFGERARRWGRKHRKSVQFGIASVVVVALIAIAAALWVNSARRQETRAKKQAEEYYRVARNSVDRWLSGVSEALQYAPGMGPMRERLLDEAARDYEKFSSFRSSDPDLEIERGRALLRLGEVQRDLGDFTTAHSTFVAAETHFEEISKRLPQAADAARVERGRALNRRGGLRAMQDDAAALEHWRSAIKLLQGELPDGPIDRDRRLMLAAAHISVGQWLERAGQATNARREVDAALDVLGGGATASLSQADKDPFAGTRLEALRLKARIENAEGNWAQARDVLGLASAAAGRTAATRPDEPAVMMTVAETQLDLATVLRKMGLLEEELAAYAAAIPTYRKLLEVIPDSAVYRESLAVALLDRGQLFTELHQWQAADRDLNEALRLSMRLVEQFPQVAQYQQELAAALDGLGRLSHLSGDFRTAREQLAKSIAIFGQLAEARPEVLDYREREAVARVQLARTQEALEDQPAADAEFSAALSLLTELRSLARAHAPLALDLAWLHKNRGDLFWERGQAVRAAAEYHSALDAWREIISKWPSSVSERSYAELLANCPVKELRDPTQAVTLARRVLAATSSENLSQSLYVLALYRAGKPAEALQSLNELTSVGTPLARDCFVKSLALGEQGDLIAAQRSFDEGLALWRGQKGDEDLRRMAMEAANALGLTLPE